MEENIEICESSAESNIEMNEHASEELELKTEQQNFEKEFQNEVQTILKKLESLPSTASELKIPIVSLDGKDVYLKLCKALKVQENSTFLSIIESKEIDLAYQSLGPVDIIPVTKALISHKMAKLVDFKYNNLGAKSLPAIISLIDQNENIVHLNLSSNDIGKGSAQLLSDLIACCQSIEFLDFSNNDLGDEELHEVAMALMKTDAVKELILGTNDFSSARCPAFGSFISKCSALLKLDLSCCHIEEGATNIFNGLKISNLTMLNLARNGIPNESMPALASGLRANKSLQELDVSFNSISNKGAVALAPGLKGSSTLEIMKLAHNPIQGSAAETLLNSVGSNLKLLDLSGIKVNLGFIKTIRNYAKSEKGVKVLFGSEIRYYMFPRDFMVPEEDSLTRENVLLFLERLADEKGVSLRNVLKNIHANFITEQHAAVSEEQAAGGKKEEKRPEMSSEDLVKGLVTCPIGIPRALAQEVAELVSVEGFVDMWDLISKVRWKPDDLYVKIKGPKKPTPGKKDKKKK